jgi:hypothetical protein
VIHLPEHNRLLKRIMRLLPPHLAGGIGVDNLDGLPSEQTAVRVRIASPTAGSIAEVGGVDEAAVGEDATVDAWGVSCIEEGRRGVCGEMGRIGGGGRIMEARVAMVAMML